MINWKVRVQQKWFWITLIPLLFLFADQVVSLAEMIMAATAGQLSGSELETLMLALVGTVFAILALVGLPVDLTTDGYGDSARALTYDRPAVNAAESAKIDYAELGDPYEDDVK